MITANKHNPVVRFIQSLGISSQYLLVIRFLFKSEATITCHNEQGVRHLILNAEFVHQLIEVTMNVAGDDDTLGFGICVCKYVVIVHLSYFINKISD